MVLFIEESIYSNFQRAEHIISIIAIKGQTTMLKPSQNFRGRR